MAQWVDVVTRTKMRGRNNSEAMARGKGISNKTFSLVWHIGSATQNGFGMRMKDTLLATYRLNGEPGLIIYRVQGNGIITGTWAIKGEKEFRTEPLVPRCHSDYCTRWSVIGGPPIGDCN